MTLRELAIKYFVARRIVEGEWSSSYEESDMKIRQEVTEVNDLLAKYGENPVEVQPISVFDISCEYDGVTPLKRPGE